MQKSISFSIILFLVLGTGLGGFMSVSGKKTRSLRQKIGEARKESAKVGEQLIVGADQLQNASALLEGGIAQLKEHLVAGLESMLKKTLQPKIIDIQNKRQQIDHFTKVIEKQKNIAEEAGKGALIKDLLEGLAEADAALAMLYNEQPPSGALIKFIESSRGTIKNTNGLIKQLNDYRVSLDQKINAKKFCFDKGFKCTLSERLKRLGAKLKKVKK